MANDIDRIILCVLMIYKPMLFWLSVWNRLHNTPRTKSWSLNFELSVIYCDFKLLGASFRAQGYSLNHVRLTKLVNRRIRLAQFIVRPW